jgi:asparagine N-glycosylation enzyme membrane subunit Stt3
MHLQWIVPASLFLLAVIVRGLPYHAVMVGERILFFGNDAYYHMRRVFYTLADFPKVIEFDPYLNYPEGAHIIWPPFFDGIIALALLPFHFLAQPDTIERIAVWIPPLLGAATVLALFHLAKRSFGFAVAGVSALILSLLSGHFWYSQLGFIDHHAAVSLASTLLLASAMALLRRLAISPEDHRSALLSGGLLALTAACILMLWPGSILYVGLIEIGLLLFILSRPDRDHAIAGAQAFCFINTVAFFLILPFSAFNSWPQWGEFSSVVLSGFQPWFFGSLAIYGLICALSWRRGTRLGFGDSLRARISQGVVIGLCVLAMSALLFPGLVQGILDAWMWISKTDSFQASVAESYPLFSGGGEVSVRIAEMRLSRFIYLFPFGILALIHSARTRRDGAPLLLFAGWSIALFAITLLQKRFFNTFSVALALTAGWSCVTAFLQLRKKFDSTSQQAIAAAGISALTIWLLAPCYAAYAFHVDNHLRAFRGAPPEYQLNVVQSVRAHATAEWLRDHTRATSGYLDTEQPPEYGVLAHWTFGHLLTYVGQRPTALGNFGDDVGRESFIEAMEIFDHHPEEAISHLEKRRVRYLVLWLTAQSPVLEDTLFRENGVDLERLRLLYVAVPTVPNQTPSFKIFELVQGARLVGYSNPGAPVEITLSLRTNLGEKLAFSARTTADGEGAYYFRLPYATSGNPGAVKTARSYRVHSLGREAPAHVDESQVQSGAKVVGPVFPDAADTNQTGGNNIDESAEPRRFGQQSAASLPVPEGAFQ